MADHHFQHGEGLGPIRFGMARSEVIAILGAPKKQYRFSQQTTSSDELDAVIDAAGMEGLKSHLADIYRGQTIDSYNNGKIDNWNGGGPLSYISSVTYLDDTVSKITSLDCKGRIFFKTIELTADTLFATIRSLHAVSDELYVDLDYLFFE